MTLARRTLTSAAIVLALLLLLLAQRGGPAPARVWPTVTRGPFPRTVQTTDGRTFALPAPPRRVFLASASVVDFALAFLGPDRIVGLCEHAFSASALAFAPGQFAHLPRHERFLAEPTLAAAPDLVLCSDYNDPSTLAALAQAGVQVVAVPAVNSLADARLALDLVGHLLGADAALATLHEDLDRRCASLAGRRGAKPLRALCFTHNPTGTWTAGRDTLTDDALNLAGLANAAIEAGIEGHAPIPVETILALDPDVIVLDAPVGTAHGSRAQLVEHPALSHLRALTTGAVIELHPALYATGSQHVVDAAEAIAARIDALGLREGGR